MPTCPKCGKFISESHYERHLRRCGTTHEQEPHPAHTLSTAAQAEGPDGAMERSPTSEEHGGGNWTKVAAFFVIFLLIGSVVVFFVLYLLSLL